MIYNILQAHEIESQFFGPEDVTLSPLPMFHIYAFLVSLHIPIHFGLPLVTMKRFDLERFCQLVEKYQVTRIHVVPPILLQLNKSPITQQFDLSTLKVAISAAAPLRSDTEAQSRERLGCKVKQLWGMSELSPLGTGNPDDRIKEGKGSVGPPLSCSEAKIVDVTTGKALGPNQEGELCFKGPQVMKGYLNDPVKTADNLTSDGWLRTGDMAMIDEDGYVFITDRLKELIKVNGFPVAPAELESLLLSHPSVLDACVIPTQDEQRGEVPRAYVVLQPDAQKTTAADELTSFIEERVAPYKWLTGGIIFTNVIAKTESGKLLRRKLVEHDRANL